MVFSFFFFFCFSLVNFMIQRDFRLFFWNPSLLSLPDELMGNRGRSAGGLSLCAPGRKERNFGFFKIFLNVFKYATTWTTKFKFDFKMITPRYANKYRRRLGNPLTSRWKLSDDNQKKTFCLFWCTVANIANPFFPSGKKKNGQKEIKKRNNSRGNEKSTRPVLLPTFSISTQM